MFKLGPGDNIMDEKVFGILDILPSGFTIDIVLFKGGRDQLKLIKQLQ